MNIKFFGEQRLIKQLFGKKSQETPEELYEKAQSLFKENKIDDGYTYLQAAAVKGHAEAAFQMGSAIFENKTYGSDEDAFKYYVISSEKDHALATTNLATCYQLGKGTEIDYIKAIQLLNKAIKLGDEMAMFNLAQTYLFGVGVKQDKVKGWSLLEILKNKGNQQAINYMNNLLEQGYEPPKVKDAPKANKPTSSKTLTDHAPDCNVSDLHILSLYNSAKDGNQEALDELMELGGNQMKRDAMNALRKLGRIKEDLTDDFKISTIQYIANVWKTYDVESLYIVSLWTYPGFVYREFENGKLLYETHLEDNFIARIADELSNCRKNHITTRFRIREVNNASKYCVDVNIQGMSLSSFYLDIQNNHFVGLYRVYDKNII